MIQNTCKLRTNSFSCDCCDDRINKEGFGAFNIVGELWLEVQELKQDLSSYQEYVGHK